MYCIFQYRDSKYFDRGEYILAIEVVVLIKFAHEAHNLNLRKL